MVFEEYLLERRKEIPTSNSSLAFSNDEFLAQEKE